VTHFTHTVFILVHKLKTRISIVLTLAWAVDSSQVSENGVKKVLQDGAGMSWEQLAPDRDLVEWVDMYIIRHCTTWLHRWHVPSVVTGPAFMSLVLVHFLKSRGAGESLLSVFSWFWMVSPFHNWIMGWGIWFWTHQSISGGQPRPGLVYQNIYKYRWWLELTHRDRLIVQNHTPPPDNSIMKITDYSEPRNRTQQSHTSSPPISKSVPVHGTWT
jgi:hypothetical protein